ncbi:MAG: hypothetical protein MI861_15055 [Pirellulales bacterium]|nr:hypothetical protein [Pirellulales bacterium]
MAGSDEPPLDALWARYQSGQLEQVVATLQVVIDEQADEGWSREAKSDRLQLLGLALHDLGRPIEASDAIEKASLIVPISDQARIALASCYAQLQRIDLARELYLQLALSRRLSPGLMLEVAAGLEAIDAPQLAMQVCQWIVEKDDSIAQAHYDMGVYSARSGHPLYMTEALTRRALQLDPQNIHYRIGLVSLLVQLDRDEEGLEVMDGVEPGDIEIVGCHTCLSRVTSLLLRHHRDELAEICNLQIEKLRKRTSSRRSISLWEATP